MKISIIGAGNVGATLADRVLRERIGDVVLLDLVRDLARGKALDISDAAPLLGCENSIVGTADYENISNSDVVVITAGFPRKPGMSREDLISKNRNVVEAVLTGVKRFSPDAIVVVVTNPLDIMTFLAYEFMGRKRNRVFGMAGNLDTARFKAILSEELGAPAGSIETFVLGSHGDTMVPLVSRTTVSGKPLKEILKAEALKKILERTKKRGGEIVALLKSGSAYFSPSAACLEILKAIVNDEKKTIVCSSFMQGEYGIKGCAIGVPARIGKGGIEEIIEWDLPEEELCELQNSAKQVKDVLNQYAL
ncbi:MAG: malate dehydrogenase [Candidatus Omnitrophica bacterium]|nr:malate dehydrogenase [Candidatus Omnitrophota bacterium]